MTPWRRRLFPRPATKRTLLVVALATAACTGAPLTVQAQEGVDKAAAAAFDNRMFAGPPGAKAYACFVRRYDENHLAQHPKQKVSAMKLLVSAENAPEDKATNYSFRLGVTYRHRSGNFDSSGYCNHAIAAESGREIRFECGVDCEGGGITTSPTTMRARRCSPAPTTRSFASIAWT
ncbi:hypothetical protein ABIF29_006088 [Bradyrhizobium elkanii]|uniref:Uncharacterized protein n=1 Tax=Bradyrhizobium elkanii TaxID=29448 RepID=A0ABV4F758_BRAEL|nr:hypothetical protein [Bradyrhizobium elkanii]MCP1750855.1 hypothetical protein [Bradyrhizobium elkanii]MCP1976629.1 hypothetical protein [Bradyrhizobium elkanii]MCS3888852.1 hypothetical protein [Bradyrhizobium elkanii]MCS4212126.1 hypothetical protein [Bradyrhizobium elkanii]